MVALDLAAQTWRSLSRAGARITITSAGLTAPRVDLSAPPSLSGVLRAAIGWRQDAMRAQLTASALNGRVPTLVALEDHYERGACGSCGEPFAEGDCPLCNAARIGVLRAAGLLPPAAPLTAEAAKTVDDWRRELAAQAPHPAPLETVASAPWTCAKCGARIEGLYPDPDLECGGCELRRISVMDPSRLGGSP